MNSYLLKLRDDRPLPHLTIALLQDVRDATRRHAIDWFAAGATARDILLDHVHGIRSSRATADIDVGVCIHSWAGHSTLRETLLSSGRFTAHSHVQHRLTFRQEPQGPATWLDIVPFGALQASDTEIAWPPDQSIRMNVCGFAEALQSAVEVHIADGLTVPVASVAAQALLKIIAWRDRHNVNRKDATDLRTLILNYADAGNMERLHTTDLPLLGEWGYDAVIAGAALLGFDAAALSTTAIRAQVEAVLGPNDEYPAILDQMLCADGPMLDAPRAATVERAFNAFRGSLLGTP